MYTAVHGADVGTFFVAVLDIVRCFISIPAVGGDHVIIGIHDHRHPGGFFDQFQAISGVTAAAFFVDITHIGIDSVVGVGFSGTGGIPTFGSGVIFISSRTSQ